MSTDDRILESRSFRFGALSHTGRGVAPRGRNRDGVWAAARIEAVALRSLRAGACHGSGLPSGHAFSLPATRLALEKTMRSLIINADDFGYDEDTVKATISCFEGGLLTSATILAGCTASRLAYDYARQHRKQLSFGLHFNIVEGRLAAQAGKSSLCGGDGMLRPCKAQRVRAMAGLLAEKDIREAFRQQLTELRDHGVQVTHVDGHGHLHKYPAVIRAIKQEMLQAGIKWARRPQNCYFQKNAIRGALNVWLLHHFSGLRHTDYYIAADPREPGWALRLPAILRDGVTEMSVHPGFAEPWRRDESAPLLQPAELAAKLKSAGIALRRYGDL